MADANAQALAHETAFIDAFVEREVRERWRTKLSSRKHRGAFLHELAHYVRFEARFISLVEPAKQNLQDVLSTLRKQGATDDCYAISECTRLDGKTLKLTDALNQVIGSGVGSILSCVPGRLAYYEGEDQGRRCLFSRPM